MEPSSVKSSSSPEDFARLQHEQAKALHATQETIKKWEAFKYDYEALQARLHTLPDKLTHDVMVPFGQFAFMPGKLYHTNEVLILLGDNWFTQRTAKQAIEMVERRKKYVCEMLDRERKQLKDWEARWGFVQELSATAEAQKDGFEIREEYDPAEEERRKKVKREERERRRGGVIVPPPRPAFPKAAATTGSGGRVKRVGKEGGLGDRKVGGGMSEEELWEKLEHQEREEEEEEEERKDGVAVPGMGGGGGVRKTTSVITFTHTEAVPCSNKPLAPDQAVESSEKPMFSNPADIFVQRQSTTTDTVKKEGEEEEGEEVGRGVRWDPNLVSYSQEKEDKERVRQDKDEERGGGGRPGQPPGTKSTAHGAKTPQAFSGQVVETGAESSGSSQQGSTRKVSKFKSSRSRPST